jgi:hypothetical protein
LGLKRDDNPSPFVKKVSPTMPIHRISPTQMRERRAKGLCYSYDEKWNSSHICKTPKLYLMTGVEIQHNEPAEEVFFDSIDGINMVEEQNSVECAETPEISIHAISGSLSPNTILIVGIIQQQMVVILVDSGSTHNFLDPATVSKARSPKLISKVIGVKVANGQLMSSEGKCPVVSIRVQGNTFCTEFYILTLGDCDSVLGIQWLRTLGLIIWDFVKFTMLFSGKGEQILLQGLTPIEISVAEGSKFLRSSNKGVMLELMGSDDFAPTETVNPLFEKLLTEFQAIFEEPKGLPPMRSHDHRILLKENTKPLCVWPYRYPYYQKMEIEKIVHDLLKSRVI